MKNDFNENINELLTAIKTTGKKKFVLQLPEGLKTRSIEIIALLESKGFEIIYAANPTYGACDLALDEVKFTRSDALIHIGHSKFYRLIETDIPVIYFSWKINFDVENIDISLINEKTIGLVTTIQHIDILEDVKKILEKNEKKVVIGGQILGCWDANAQNIENDVDAFLFIGSGQFHSLALKTNKPVYVYSMESNQITKTDKTIEKRFWAMIYNARNARTFGILVSTKPGQYELLGSAKNIKEILEQHQRKAIIIVMNEITDEKLQGIAADAFINTACPRILDDTFSKPIINAQDIDKIFDN